MVLFENVHVGNCRSETRSAFALSPLKTPILLFGVISAFLLHVAAMHSRFGAAVLRTEAVGLRTWIALGGLALTIFFVMEAHKWLWNRREARRAA
jgi:hypothetical protein